MKPVLDPRVTLITLGVADVKRARAFYEGVIGWSPFMAMEEIAFYDLGGMVLGLFDNGGFATDMAQVEQSAIPRFRGLALAQNLLSREEVDAAFARLAAQGVKILKPPHAADWGGYSGYFADPDGHAWELAFNPHWPLAQDGRVLPPKAA